MILKKFLIKLDQHFKLKHSDSYTGSCNQLSSNMRVPLKPIENSSSVNNIDSYLIKEDEITILLDKPPDEAKPDCFIIENPVQVVLSRASSTESIDTVDSSAATNTSTSSSSSVQDLNQANDLYSNELDELLFKDNKYLISIQHAANQLDNHDFGLLMEIIETYNRLISFFHTSSLDLDEISSNYLQGVNLNSVRRIRVDKLIKSILNDSKEMGYYEDIIKTLIYVILVKEELFRSNHLFNIEFKAMFQQNKRFNLIDLCSLLFRFEATMRSRKDRCFDLEEEYKSDELYNELSRNESLSDLGASVKLDVCKRFVDMILFNERGRFMKRVEKKEADTLILEERVSGFRNAKAEHEMRRRIYDLGFDLNIVHYDSRIKDLEKGMCVANSVGNVLIFSLSLKKRCFSFNKFFF